MQIQGRPPGRLFLRTQIPSNWATSPADVTIDNPGTAHDGAGSCRTGSGQSWPPVRENRVKTTTYAIVSGLLALGLLCCYATASGPSISDPDMNITLTLPEGFERFTDLSAPPEYEIRYAFSRPNPDGRTAVCVRVIPLDRAIGRKEVPDSEIRLHPGADVYHAKWKSFDLQVFKVKTTQHGLAYITRNVQIPVKPHAMQLQVIGLQSQDAELAALTRTLLASLDGPSNWGRPGETDVGAKQAVFWLVAIGAVVFGLVRWREYCFRQKAIQMGLPAAMANQTIHPRGRWYLLAVYLFLIGASVIAVMCFLHPRDRGWWEGLFWLNAVASLVIMGSVMRLRGRAKRRILDSYRRPPALPPEEPSYDHSAGVWITPAAVSVLGSNIRTNN